MSWVRRVSPGDPAYFCNCPPCPFCFEWVKEGDDARKRKSRERPTTLRFSLSILAGIAVALTVGITLLEQNLSTASSEHAADPATATRKSDAARQEPIPIRLAVTSSPETGVTVSVHNGNAAPLDLKVTAVDPSSGSQSMVAVNVPALETIDLTRAGLIAEQGYQLTLESPGYVSRKLMVQ